MKKKLINTFTTLFLILVLIIIAFDINSTNAKIIINNDIIKESEKFTNSIPESIVINTGNTIIGNIYYDDYYLQAKRINCEIGIPYCLEIEKNYPSGENFISIGNVRNDIIGILAAGYPNKSIKELGVDTENDAYFATQIALWSKIEGYDINKFQISNIKILDAIKNIYANSENYTSQDVRHTLLEYETSANSVQRIVLYIENSVEVNPSPDNSINSPKIDNSNILKDTNEILDNKGKGNG
ncbi:MAG: thioester domain-containing protein [Clostridium celatum]|mgnify:CR=1 FL=1|nr:thioester domain-containing protein [Clostridium celatum]